MDLAKVDDFFNYYDLGKPIIHIIGCGAVGSHIIEQLARMGVTEMHIYDFDKVESHNLANQKFTLSQVGMLKVDACEELALNINPDINITKHKEGLQEPYKLTKGIVIMAADKMDVRRSIVNANRLNPKIICILDFRMRLTDGQVYFATGGNQKEMKYLYMTMDFTDEEALKYTPVSACGVSLSVCYNVNAMVCLGIANLVNFLLNKPYKIFAMIDLQNLTIQV